LQSQKSSKIVAVLHSRLEWVCAEKTFQNFKTNKKKFKEDQKQTKGTSN
jgi:hypothetical protein